MADQALKPREEAIKAFQVAGLNKAYTYEQLKDIPEQWTKFSKDYVAKIPSRASKITYGVTWNFRPNTGMDYLAAVEVSSSKDLPKELTVTTIPGRKYAVFSLNGHVSEIHGLFGRIHEEWRPETNLKPDDEGMIFEKYLESFDPISGRGGIELWIPLN